MTSTTAMMFGDERHGTDTINRAIDALKSKNLAIRIDAIHALDRIARSSDPHHWPIMETLAAHVRDMAPWPTNDRDRVETLPGTLTEIPSLESPVGRGPVAREREGKARPPADIQTAMTVLGRRDLALSPILRLCPHWLRTVLVRRNRRPLPEEAAHRLDLRDADLSGIRLRRGEGHFQFAVFRGSRLVQTDLTGAELMSANLQNADLSNANLQDADLGSAFLQGASLRSASLRGAYLWDASLNGCYLRGADLRGAGLVDANLRTAELRGADLRGADLKLADLRGAKGLTCEQLTKAFGWQRAYRDDQLACGAEIPN